MLTELVAKLASTSVEKLEQKDPEQLKEITELFTNLVRLSTELIKVSPEFRQAFGEVHSEFLKYPECRISIQQGLNSYLEMTQDHS